MNGTATEMADYWKAGGWLLLPLLAVCFGIWLAYLTSRLRGLAALRACRVLLARAENAAGEAPALPLAADGARSAIMGLVPAWKSIAQGCDAGAALDRAGDAVVDRLRRDLLVLGALTAVAPLLGLLGTVTGMIGTFGAVSDISSETSRRVADGISQALITTQFGLVIAIPGVFGIARLRRLSDQVGGIWAQCRSFILLAAERHGTERAVTLLFSDAEGGM